MNTSLPNEKNKLTPKLLLCLKNYKAQDFTSDLIAGLTVGLVALPLSMAFGIASGVIPQAGLYTAVVAGFIISALVGSRTQIGGPTGAFVVIVAGIIARFGVSGLLMVTLMAGILLIVMGMTGLGTAVKFIPRPVTIGFTNGIALLIASTQIKDFLGLQTPTVPSEFLGRIEALGKHLGTTHLPTVLVASMSLAVILLVPRVTKKIPGSIVALLLGTVATALLHLPIATIGSKFGGIGSPLPAVLPDQATSLHQAVATTDGITYYLPNVAPGQPRYPRQIVTGSYSHLASTVGTLEEHNGSLSLEGKPYGRVAKGDHVQITSDKRVIVNGTERLPN